jgi:hypothetical protein
MLQARTSLGRGSANDIVLGDDPRISGRHCVLIREGDRIFVQDQQSMRRHLRQQGGESRRPIYWKTATCWGWGDTTLRITWRGA